MIDIESRVIDTVTEALSKKYEGIYVTSEYVPSPSRYPCVFITQSENSVVASTQDSGSNENHARLTVTVEIFSNKSTGKKRECKAIAEDIDAILASANFTRRQLFPVTNMDKSIYRMYGKYTVIASENILYGG